jgi:hypothetical protein
MPAASPGGSLRHVRIDVITIFPQLVSEPLGASLLGKAIDADVVGATATSAPTPAPLQSVVMASFKAAKIATTATKTMKTIVATTAEAPPVATA